MKDPVELLLNPTNEGILALNISVEINRLLGTIPSQGACRSAALASRDAASRHLRAAAPASFPPLPCGVDHVAKAAGVDGFILRRGERDYTNPTPLELCEAALATGASLPEFQQVIARETTHLNAATERLRQKLATEQPGQGEALLAWLKRQNP